jgi:hypothetical protein
VVFGELEKSLSDHRIWFMEETIRDEGQVVDSRM